MPPIRVLVVVLVTTTAMLGGVGMLSGGNVERVVTPSETNAHVLQTTVELSLLDNVQGLLERIDALLETVVDLLETLQQLFGESEETGD